MSTIVFTVCCAMMQLQELRINETRLLHRLMVMCVDRAGCMVGGTMRITCDCGMELEPKDGKGVIETTCPACKTVHYTKSTKPKPNERNEAAVAMMWTGAFVFVFLCVIGSCETINGWLQSIR